MRSVFCCSSKRRRKTRHTGVPASVLKNQSLGYCRLLTLYGSADVGDAAGAAGDGLRVACLVAVVVVVVPR